MKYALALIVALILNATANLLIKFGMRAMDIELAGMSPLQDGLWGLLRLLMRHWLIIAGLACFALNIVFYAFALQKLPISIAYPIMVTTGFAIIVTVAGMKLKENLSPLQWAGVVIILIGVAMVAKDANRQMGSPPKASDSLKKTEIPLSTHGSSTPL